MVLEQLDESAVGHVSSLADTFSFELYLVFVPLVFLVKGLFHYRVAPSLRIHVVHVRKAHASQVVLVLQGSGHSA